MLNDPLAATFAKIINAEKVGKREVLVRTSSKMIKQVLSILNEHNYVGTFEEIDDSRGKMLRINLLGNINKCGVVKPRFSAKSKAFEKWEKRYLPAQDFGIIIVSTPQGLVTHYSAKEKNLGGKLIAYCY